MCAASGTRAARSGGAKRHAETLLTVARASIGRGLDARGPLEIDPQDYPPDLREIRATFVTLRRRGELRGCTGSLDATRPLVTDVAHAAHRSAFKDPRFPALTRAEFDEIEVDISILGPMEAIAADSEAALLGCLRPGVDGLVLRKGALTSTFLPSVWKSLPEPRDFLAELRHKAGLRRDHWSPELRFDRYTVEEIV